MDDLDAPVGHVAERELVPGPAGALLERRPLDAYRDPDGDEFGSVVLTVLVGVVELFIVWPRRAARV